MNCFTKTNRQLVDFFKDTFLTKKGILGVLEGVMYIAILLSGFVAAFFVLEWMDTDSRLTALIVLAIGLLLSFCAMIYAVTLVDNCKNKEL